MDRDVPSLCYTGSTSPQETSSAKHLCLQGVVREERDTTIHFLKKTSLFSDIPSDITEAVFDCGKSTLKFPLLRTINTRHFVA